MTEQPQQAELPEWDKDLPERVAAFNAAVQPLLGKYELALAARPGFTPDGRIGADPMLLSMRKKPEETPAEATAPAKEEAAPTLSE